MYNFDPIYFFDQTKKAFRQQLKKTMSMKTLGSLSILFAFIHFDMTAAKLFNYVLTIFIMILKKTCDDFSLNLHRRIKVLRCDAFLLFD